MATTELATLVEPLLSLDDLAVIANREHGLTVHHGEAMVRHAVVAGEALNQAKALVPWGEWMSWLAQNFDGTRTTSTLYRRLALNRHLIEGQNFHSLNAATLWLQTEEQASLPRRRTQARIDEARRLVAAGNRVTDVAELVGVNSSTVYGWLRKDYKQSRATSNARARAARKALLRQERDTAARRVGGPQGEAYSQIRKLAQILERARECAPNRAAGEALSHALTGLYSVEDSVVRAIGESHDDIKPTKRSDYVPRDEIVRALGVT